MKKAVIFTSLGLCLASLASAANPLPSTPTYLGIDYIALGAREGDKVGTVNNGGGGEFVGNITRTSGGSQVAGSTISTNFWCVDDQEQFVPSSSAGYADVVAISGIAANASKVRYSNATDTGSPQWTNTTITTANDIPSAATARYEMAAYLVQQYNGFNQTISSVGPIAGACADVGFGTSCADRNNAIQNAIWAVTSNTTYNTNTTTVGQAGLQAKYWIQQAMTGYTSINASGWAVVSWDTASASNGSLTGSPMQTFLVQIATPEPQFVFLALLPLAAIFFSIRRRRAKASL